MGERWGRCRAAAQSTQQEAPISIHPFLKGAVFEPSDIAAIAAAFDETCRTLQLAAGAPIVREVVAKRVIELAQRGVRDPEKLQTEALKALNLASGR